jgi:hypothetical protein
MILAIESDPRYPGMTEAGRAELAVYLQWIQDVKLPDTEYSFVAYAIGRASLLDPRHLLKIWDSRVGKQASTDVKRQIRRFFMNPSQTVSFCQPGSAGWFDFMQSVYLLKDQVMFIPLSYPQFIKVGFAEVPKTNSATGYV